MPYVSGLDPGKTVDPAALVCLEMTEGTDPLCPGRLAWHYALRLARQWPLGTPYCSIGQQVGLGEQVRDIFALEPLRGSVCAVDQTGVGNAVIDVLRGLRPACVLTGIVQTGGEGFRRDGLTWHVSKAQLVSTLVGVMHSGRLKVAPALALAPMIAQQLASFREKQKPSGHTGWEAESGQKDDLVMALATALFLGERSPPFRRSDISTGQRVAAAALPAGVFMDERRAGGERGQRGLPGRW